eukprot:gnl/TRDRNA2_/TRDRNA2_187298_c0_seq1.p1 gnl/TRDRNA2_/TRDRNA2_187298_c0~~gnl/TRDRNA2_/TRDRNA2_187298_c0_seq1.p1  ORF type:complete len:406 (+),score=81.26 gnl/TRDRNA2_/TRDRNA2_187298_c0_seq1:86-1303(+)
MAPTSATLLLPILAVAAHRYPAALDEVIRLSSFIPSNGDAAASIISAAPKVELHVHGDGSLDEETLWHIITLRDMQSRLPADVKCASDLRKYIRRPHSTSLTNFLEAFNFFYPFITDSPAALKAMADSFVRQKAATNTIYAEYRYAPQLLLTTNGSRAGLSLEALVNATQIGLETGMAANNNTVRVRQLLCCYRNLPPSACHDIVELAKRRPDIVAGIDLAGDEHDYPDTAWISVFQKAAQSGVRRTVHTGETPGSLPDCTTAVHDMHAERLGHGYQCMKNVSLIEEIRKRHIHLEACPSSSVGTGSVAIALSPQHPIAAFARSGLDFGLNTDDPGVLLTNMTHELQLGKDALKFSVAQLALSSVNAALAAFLPSEEAMVLAEQVAQGWLAVLRAARPAAVEMLV